MVLNFKWGDNIPTYFIASKSDIGVISGQMRGRKFDPAIILGVASRCESGRPSVILCRTLRGGVPFPNSFWLSCPILVKKAGQLESSGGVKELELHIKAKSAADWEAYSRLHAEIRVALADKDELEHLRQNNPPLYKSFCDKNIGIGGIRINGEVRVKCLHLQIASFLTLGTHPGQDWLRQGASPLDPFRGAPHWPGRPGAAEAKDGRERPPQPPPKGPGGLLESR